ncbi:telomerase-binding protein EST1A isoform X2 [Anopheles funestus]|uniref:telomerase-binding protein EST1A isoform X2 n=1 Tax=Anopheles funestus TaxID=62324 RepID=UPI0020C721C9|nr:telomerase-binding protein EST1A isoform X2 [Anopheles funestus]
MKNATVPPAVVSSTTTSGSSRGISNKRQQQIYSPGSGPLRKTESTGNNRSHNSDQSEDQPRPRWAVEGSDPVTSGSNRGGSSSDVQQPLMDSSVTGTRAAGSVNWRLEGQSNHVNHIAGRDEMNPRNFLPNNVPVNSRADRMQRDSRSVEPRFVGGSKKSSIPSLSHLENLAPRLQKKTLQDLGLPQNYLEIKRAEYQQAMSQTLPNRNCSRQNRGRIRYSGGGPGGGAGNSACYSNAPYNTGRSMGGGRQMNDEYYPRPRSRSSEVDTVPERGYPPRRGGQNNRERNMEAGNSSRNSSCDRKDRPRGTPTGYVGDGSRAGIRYRQYSTDSNSTMPDMQSSEELNVMFNDGVPLYKSTNQKESFDWADDDGSEYNDHTGRRWHGNVDMELIPPPCSKSAPLVGNYRNRQRNRSDSRSRNDYYDEFKAPYQPQRNSNRSRRNSQSSNVSRENSSERPYSRGHSNRRGHYRDASSDRNYEAGGRFRRHSRDRYINRSRDNSLKRDAGDRPHDEDYSDNWRGANFNNGAGPLVHKTDQAIAEMTKQFESSIGIQKAPGVLVIPTRLSRNSVETVGPEGSDHVATKMLFDPKNPSQPIVVTRTLSRGHPRESFRRDEARDLASYNLKISGGPAWYNPDAQQAKLLRQKDLVYQVVQADAQLQELNERSNLFTEWDEYVAIRHRLQQLLETFLVKEMRFAQDVNLEHHFWKLLFYGIIEQLRKMLSETQDEQRKRYLQDRALEVVESGSNYFEQLLALLEREYRFNLDQFIGANAASSVKGLRYGLALVSSQKIFLFLGDLARYREQITESHNYRKAKQWYVKAQQILPKNGRPYNQLALLSVYAKRKIDAVYFYMRSLMSSNPFESARESLMDLFNETKKKFESNQRKREEKLHARRKVKEQRFDGNLRREIWIHPEGGLRLHRTGPIYPIGVSNSCDTSDEEELHSLSSIELNKRFITSFLHVLGKLITKTGMESFTQCAYQMLREFRALMQYSPIAVTSYRLLQLMSLNMFAIEMTKLKDSSTAQVTRSELQECALSSGLLMFGILLERLIRLIEEALETVKTHPKGTENDESGTGEIPKLILPEDAKVILPAIKVWCDWMMSNTETWNPPPCCADFKIGKSTAHDPWSELAILMNILKCLDTNRSILSVEQKDGYETVRLLEDITLAGFTPLMYYEPEPIFVHPECDMEEAQNVLRIQKLLYFGTDRMCNCDPPVLCREAVLYGTAENAAQFYSVVESRIDGLGDMDILLESFSDGETQPTPNDENALTDAPKNAEGTEMQTKVEGCTSPSGDSGVLSCSSSTSPSSLETRKLLRLKDELERKQRMQEKHNQRVQDILSQSTIAVTIEVRPRFLVPDTNCFVDYLPAIEMIAKAHPLYQLMIPIIVINELEGLSKGIRHQAPKQQTLAGSAVNELLVPPSKSFALPTAPASAADAGTLPTTNSASIPYLQHAAKVAESSKKALHFIKSRNPPLKCVTTKGSILKTSTFTVEDDVGDLKSNDDRILETALNLCRHNVKDKQIGNRYLTLDVVLLTTDRNLRVKAISNDLPVRELPDFIKWAGLSA